MKVSRLSDKVNVTHKPINTKFIDGNTNASKVLEFINCNRGVTITEIHEQSNINKGSINSGLIYLMNNPELCEIERVDRELATAKGCGATYKLIALHCSIKEYAMNAKKKNGKSTKPGVKRVKQKAIKLFSQQPIGDISFSSRANGYGVGGVYCG